MSSVLEILIAVLYLVGAVFNTVYTLRHGEEFYTDFVEKAWLRPARSLVESGGMFAAVVALVSSPWGTVGNLALAAVQLLLAGLR